ncbi:MAG: LysM peptidoglycan-binding domain-containing protein [Hespellia sp.]|nr:LysM peptidoglycan-binding domain-containing protein [Hespellia sp.]
MSRERFYLEKKRRVDVMKKKILLFVCTLAIVTIFSGTLASAHDERTNKPADYTYYKSIEIQPGDTLWNIARTYMTDDYDSIESYISELKAINSLCSDDIQDSMYLMVAYNDSSI